MTDAAGSQNTLLVRNSLRPFETGVNDSTLALRLRPGRLNARFESGRLIRGVGPSARGGKLVIHVNGGSYPLTLHLASNVLNRITYALHQPGTTAVPLTDATDLTITDPSDGTITLDVQPDRPCQ